MYYIYILKCQDGSFYTGITNDIKRRLSQHNSGHASKYTRIRRPVKLKYKEEAPDRSGALKREIQIKRMTRQGKEKLIKNKRKT